MAGVVAAVACATAGARDLTGRITHVGDGDSLWLQPGPAKPPIEVRLSGIDAPELCQAWGRQARDALAALVGGREVVLHTVGRDDYGRTLGVVRVGDIEVNRWLVEHGHAWSGRWNGRGGPLLAEEQLARRLRRGLHAEGDALQPRWFRQMHGPCGPRRERARPPQPRAARGGRIRRRIGAESGRAGRRLASYAPRRD